MVRTSKQSFITRNSIIGGLVGGLVHTGLAIFLWYTWFDSLWEMLVTKPLNGAYVVLGMFLLGFVPVMFYISEKVTSPAIVVAVLLLISGLGSWQSGSVLAPSAGPTPFALYILLWVGVVALVSLIGILEYRRKQQTASA